MVISQPPPNMLGGVATAAAPPPASFQQLGQKPTGTTLAGVVTGGTPVVGPDGTIIDFDGKRLRKTMMRKTIDYNSSFLNMIQNRIWQRDARDRRGIQPDICYYPALVPPQQLKDNPVNAVTTRFVKTATNKMRCPIFCLSWTPDGRRLITGASSGEFTLWNGLTFNFETILQAHDTPVRAMKWSNNESWMVTGDHGGYIKYWQSNMNNVKMFQAHKDPVRQVSFSPTDTKFASCSDDGTVRIWDFQKCLEERVLRGHGSDVKCCDWHPVKGIVVSGSKDNQQPIKLWDPRNGTVLMTIHAHKSTVMDCRWNKNGNWLVTASRDHLLKLFDIRNLKEEVQTFRGHKKEAASVAWHPIHEGMFSSGGSDGSIIFWNVNQEKEIGVIDQGHESIVWTSVWHPVGHILTTGSNDHTVKFWSRNRPGDPMRDKYNLNTLPPGVEEDTGNLADVNEKKGSGNIPGLSSTDGSIKSEKKLSIPGLDVQIGPEEAELSKPVQAAKPVSRGFQPAWQSNLDKRPEDRGIKRSLGEREQGGPLLAANHHFPMAAAQQQQRQPPEQQREPPASAQSQAITLSQLQQEATAVVAKGQIIPVLPGGPLYQSIGAGEMAIRDILHREFNIDGRGRPQPPPANQEFGGGQFQNPGMIPPSLGPPPPMHLGPPVGHHSGGGHPPGPSGGGGGGPGHHHQQHHHHHHQPPHHHQSKSNNWGGGGGGHFDRGGGRRDRDAGGDENYGGRRHNNWGDGGGGRDRGGGGRGGRNRMQ